ncbi:Ger(x)C family spore germination protein [Mesobacillus subterraneus]|uniref:Ger(X)C family spore germination protein n=1 Tax=Mesobacillus subterraneus TaxID=285983 RepID=A0A0D6ZEH9_9BACI|nr:Ger(x)C family spore germination protein [Mesobacillus subterraneus]KIY23917.1 hypothetical protein UB32_00055 [Mesobacillus subterraneus]
MKQHRWLKIILLCLLTMGLAGCWDKQELNEKAFVIGIGLDKDEEEGKVKVTYLITNPEAGAQQAGGTTKEPPQEIISLVADDFISSRDTANAIVAKSISYNLLSVLIVSEDLARDPNFIRLIYSAAKDREIKRSLKIIVTKEKAEAFINNNKPKLETRPDNYFGLIINRGQKIGMIPDANLKSFFTDTEGDADFFLAIYATTDKEQRDKENTSDDNLIAGEIKEEGTSNNTEMIGSAVFSQGQMIGKMTGEETRISSLLDDTWNAVDILTAYPDPFDERYRLTVRMSKQKNNTYKLTNDYGRPHFEITVPLYIEVLSDPSMVNYAGNKQKVVKLKQYLTDNIEKKMQQFIEKTQKEFKGDTFHLSVPFRKHFATLGEFRDFDWMKTYPDAEVNVKVEIHFGEFGRQTKLPKLKEVRD